MANVHIGNRKDDSDRKNGVKTLLLEVFKGGDLSTQGVFPNSVVKTYFPKRYSNIFKTSIKDIQN